MEELRDAVQALVAEAGTAKREMNAMGDIPLREQLHSLQQCVDRVQRNLNRLQTAMDTWSEEKEEV